MPLAHSAPATQLSERANPQLQQPKIANQVDEDDNEGDDDKDAKSACGGDNCS